MQVQAEAEVQVQVEAGGAGGGGGGGGGGGKLHGMYTARSTRTAPLSDGMRALPSVSWGVHGGGSLFVPSRRRRCVSRAPRAAHRLSSRTGFEVDRSLAVRSEVAKWWIVCWSLASEPLGSF